MRKRIILIISIVVFAILAIFLTSKPKKIRDLVDVLDEGRLTVVIESGMYGFTRDSAEIYGFQYEIIKAFADSLGVELVLIHQKNNKSVYQKLETNECDILVSLKPVITDTLASIVSLSPILNSRLILVQHQQAIGGGLIRKQYELDGDTLYTTKSSAFIDKLNYLFDDLAIDVSVVEMMDVNTIDLIEMVNAQKIKFTFCLEYLSEALKQDYPDLNFSVALSFPFDLAWSVHSESLHLREKLNVFLIDFIDSQDFIDLKKKYYIK